MDSRPATDASGTKPISTALPRAQAISTGRRRRRSSQTPANSESSSTGTKRSAFSTPTSATVGSSVSTATSGIVNWVTWVPISETDSPAHSLTKSGLDKTPRAGAAAGPACGAGTFMIWSDAIAGRCARGGQARGGQVGLRDARPARLELRGKHAVADAEPLRGDDEAADPLVLFEGGV